MIALVALGSVFAGIVHFWLFHPLLQYPDQAMYLGTAGLLLDGKKLYVDMVDFNPPLITYLSIPAVMLARSAHLPTTMAFAFYLEGLMLVSVLVSGYLMYRNRDHRDSFFFIPVLLGFLFVCRQEWLDFGQRESMLIITYLPFFFVRFLRWNGTAIPLWIAIFSGLYAALTLALKPHFLLMAAAPELVYLLQKRRWKELFTPETYSCAALGIAYGVHLLFLDPAVSDRFYHFVLPLVKAGYDYYTVSFIKTIADYSRPATYMLAFTLIAAIPLSRFCSLIAPTAAFTVAALGIYLMASQDWSHHWVPVEFGRWILTWLEIAVVARFLCSYSAHSRLLNMYMCGAVLALGLFLSTVQNLPAPLIPEARFDLSRIGYQGYGPKDDVGPWADLVLAHSKKGDPILFISDAISPGYPSTLQLERSPASRYMHGMPLMMAKYLAWEKPRVQDRLKYNQFFEQIINEYDQDIKKNKPPLIIIRDGGIVEPLTKGGFFDRSLIDYEKIGDTEGHLVYKRK